MEENSSVKILLVDDRAENLFALEVILSSENYLCMRANSGKEALKILRNEQDFAIILLDVQMPVMDGFETLELIRKIESFKHTPVIFLTAGMDAEQVYKGYQAGAVDYIIKPFLPEILKAKVAVFVDLYKKTKELLIQYKEKEKRANELIIAGKELDFQNEEKEKRATELGIANIKLAFQDGEKEKRAAELIIANKELVFQNREKEKRADELMMANKELAYQNEEKEKRAEELDIANKELAFQNEEKEKRAAELGIANKKLVFQNTEKGKRAAELIIANKELTFQNREKEKRADELIIANKELVFQNEEKEKRAAELIIADKEVVFQNAEKEKRAAELIISNKEFTFKNEESEERFKTIFNDVPIGIALIDSLTGKFFNVNPMFAKIAGRTIAEMADIDWMSITHPDDIHLDLDNMAKLVASEISGFQMEKRYILPDRSLVWINMTVSSILHDDKLHPRHLCMIEDITELKRMVLNLKEKNEQIEAQNEKYIQVNKELAFQNEEKGKRAAELVIADNEIVIQNKEKEKRATENKKLEALSDSLKLASQYSLSLIEASRDPLVTISTEGKIMDMNEAFANIIEMTREKLIGTDFFDYFTDSQKAREVYQEVFVKGFVADYPLTIRDVKLTDVLFNGSVYKNEKGNVLGAVVVARDITEQKRFETELIEAKVFAEMATIIAEEEKSKAENAVKAKQQFLSNMSHEIRTPMNAIIGFTKVVLKTDLSAKQKEYLTAIKMSGDALIVLINDILDLAKVDAGKMTFEQTPFKMALSISAMLHLFETKIQEKNLELVKEYDNKIPEILVGDPVRLRQIILNLVSNAVKFTTKGKITVSIRLQSEDEDKATIEFAVTDTGIGIPENKMDKIFENFQQASSGTARLYGGTGLGLSIVKQLIETQGGIISVKSIINEGTTFSFILSFPKTKDELESETELAELDTEIKNIKVLVVEDMALNQLLMKTLLDDFGFERDIASNGKIAIEKLQSKSYDIILMDLQMPEMNGFEATDYIRNKLNSNIPIIALTADVTTVDFAKCKAFGMNDYIAKPIDERLLYSKILDLVKKPIPIATAIKYYEDNVNGNGQGKKVRCIDMDSLIHRTKSNPKLMMEIISLYLEQTPPLISAMKQSLHDKDWHSLYTSVHKMIPSFSIMGISTDFENMAKQVQEYAITQQQTNLIPDLVLQLGNICTQACIELEEELTELKTLTNEQL